METGIIYMTGVPTHPRELVLEIQCVQVLIEHPEIVENHLLHKRALISRVPTGFHVVAPFSSLFLKVFSALCILSICSVILLKCVFVSWSVQQPGTVWGLPVPGLHLRKTAVAVDA